MQSFISLFHMLAYYLNISSKWPMKVGECVAMKFKNFQWSSIMVSKLLVTLYSKFDPDETQLFSSIIVFAYVSYHLMQTKPHITLVRMDSDRIRMESDSDITFYHILNRIRIRIQIFSNADAKRVARIGIYHRIFTQFNSKWISLSTSIQTNNISCQNILPVTISMIKYI
jgi:hypothetical protein